MKEESENMKRARREYGKGVEIYRAFRTGICRSDGVFIEYENGDIRLDNYPCFVYYDGKWAEIVEPKEGPVVFPEEINRLQIGLKEALSQKLKPKEEIKQFDKDLENAYNRGVAYGYRQRDLEVCENTEGATVTMPYSKYIELRDINEGLLIKFALYLEDEENRGFEDHIEPFLKQLNNK